jgi:hypothetical protein
MSSLPSFKQKPFQWILLLLIINLAEQHIITLSGSAAQSGLWPPHHARFPDHTQRRATVGGTPLGQVINSSQRRLPDNTQQTSMTPVRFEPTIAAGERP